MARTFIYQCPVTGTNVQDRAEVDEEPIDLRLFKPVHCMACGRLHLINPYCGQLLATRTTSSGPDPTAQFRVALHR